MSMLKKLPVFYQNAKVAKIEQDNDEQKKPVEKWQYISAPFYQTDTHPVNIYYKPISKIWTIKNKSDE